MEIPTKIEIEPIHTGPKSEVIQEITIQAHTDQKKSGTTFELCTVYYPNTKQKLYIGIFVKLGMALNIMLLSCVLW